MLFDQIDKTENSTEKRDLGENKKGHRMKLKKRGKLRETSRAEKERKCVTFKKPWQDAEYYFAAHNMVQTDWGPHHLWR